MRKFIFGFAAFILSTSVSLAQISASNSDTAPRSASSAGQASPMGYGTSSTLTQLEEVAQSTITDLGRVRVEKWKTNSRDKDQARSNLESLQRNLTAALPTLIQQVRENPSSVAANVKLYRNLNALYDVLASFTESAGAFGSQDDYNALARDSANLDTARRSWADQLEQMAAAQDAQVARLTEQAKAQAAAALPVTPTKRVVVDDNAPAKKAPSTKKKPAAKKTPTPQ